MSYVVTALKDSDDVISLPFDADSEAQAAEQARRQGYIVLGVKRRMAMRRAARRTRFSAGLFSQELLALLAAGLTLVEAIEALSRKRQYAEELVVGDLLQALKQGHSFSNAIGRHPVHFTSLYVATVQASERTGSLQEALARYVAWLEQITQLRKRIASASLYPALLALVGTLVILFLLFYVIPRFATVYESFAGTLPFFSRALIGFGRFIADYGGLVGLVLVAVVVALTIAARSPSARLAFAGTINRMPWIAESLRLYELTRLYRTFGMLLKAGLPVLRATDMLAPLLSMGTRNRLAAARRRIAEGQALSTAMTDAGLVTPIAERFLRVGERTGNMGEMMERLAAFHDDELARSIQDFARLFEPVLMLMLGLIVGAIVVLMYLPIFELATAVQS